MKLQTPVTFPRSKVTVSFSDSIIILGSCFADNIGQKMRNSGYDVCVNPFGTLYNPVSIANAAARLDSAVPFSGKDCVEMGAGAGLFCSFSHHTSFARQDAAQFLEVANASLARASEKWRNAGIVMVTLGTAFCYRRVSDGEVVANCLKRPAGEFSKELLTAGNVSLLLENIVKRHPDKRFIFTVSPIRHMSDGAHSNQLSKSTLLLALEPLLNRPNVEYFPAYEIVLDELRDYRFYADDMTHPSDLAAGYIWDRFCDFAVPDDERDTLMKNTKAWRQSQHRPLH